MRAFLYTLAVQCKLDLRSKTMLITCYLVPLLFFVFMGSIFSAVNPQAKDTLIASMTVLGVSMGALIGLPPTLTEMYGGECKKIYLANGMPLFFGAIVMCLSALIHLCVMSALLFVAAPLLFDAALPQNFAQYCLGLLVFIVVSLSVGCVLGLSCHQQAKLTMLSQVIFLPSILLSGILFPAELLPRPLKWLAQLFPATWGNRLMTQERWNPLALAGMLFLFVLCVVLCLLLLTRKANQ